MWVIGHIQVEVGVWNPSQSECYRLLVFEQEYKQGENDANEKTKVNVDNDNAKESDAPQNRLYFRHLPHFYGVLHLYKHSFESHDDYRGKHRLELKTRLPRWKKIF